MPKSSNIKWRQADKAKLSKTVGKFNSKRTRLINKVPELSEILPERQSVGELTSSIKTRNDFNKVINRLERFMKKGAEENVVTNTGVRTTKYQINELAIQHRQINQQRAKLRKERQPSTEKGTMGSIRKMNLKPKQNNAMNIPKHMWDRYVKGIERQTMDDYYNNSKFQYKMNYLKALMEWDNGADSDFVETIKKMSAEDVYNLYYYDSALQLDFWYSLEEHEIRMEQMNEKLSQYIEENNPVLSDSNLEEIENEMDRRLRNKYAS